MSIAFPALLIFLLVLPGIIIRRTYQRGFWRHSPSVSSAVTEDVAYGLVWAILLHIFWIKFLVYLGYHVAISETLWLLVGNPATYPQHLNLLIQSISDHPLRPAYYFVGVCVCSAIAGLVGHGFVRETRLDRRFQYLRFNNDWYYLLSGELLEFEGIQSPKEVGFTYLTAVVEQGNEAYLYRGLVAAYYFDAAGNLDRVLLEFARRRHLSKDRRRGQKHDMSASTWPYYPIEGDIFVLRYSEMRTINVQYWSVQ